jgi:SurA N-terminal domain
VRYLALTAVGVTLLAGCGGSGNGKAVAHVGDDTITTKQLEALVAHFEREAKQEGKDFPAKGTQQYNQLQRQLLGLLVYRTELKQAADRLGVKVSHDELSKRLAAAASSGEQEDTNGDTFARDSVEAQLLTEGIAAKVTRGVKGKDAADTAAKRNQKLTDYLARLQRETTVRYEPGYGPGS